MSLNVAHQYYRDPPVASAGSSILRNRCLINTTINRNCRCRRHQTETLSVATPRQTSGRIVAAWKIISRNKPPRVPVSIATERCVFVQKAADFQQVVPRVRPLARPVKWTAFELRQSYRDTISLAICRLIFLFRGDVLFFFLTINWSSGVAASAQAVPWRRLV